LRTERTICETDLKQSKWDRLRKLGYRATNTREFLGLSDEETVLIDLKISLIGKLRETRGAKKVTQQHLRMRRSIPFLLRVLRVFAV